MPEYEKKELKIDLKNSPIIIQKSRNTRRIHRTYKDIPLQLSKTHKNLQSSFIEYWNLYITETAIYSTSDKMTTFTAILHKEEGMYVAECPEVGTISQGETIEEAINNLKEATELYLEEFSLKEDRKTLMTTFEVVVSAKT